MATASPLGDVPPVLTTQQVAELLSLNPVTVRQMAKDGRLRARRVAGSRKFMFLAEDVAELLDAAVVSSEQVGEARQSEPDDADPCDVWGAAPAGKGDADFQSRCLQRWLDLAADRGIVPSQVRAELECANGYVGEVMIDDLTYVVCHGRRQRVRVVDDDGANRWELIDSVWVEPADAPFEA